jgi:nicotinic acid phosphoribosyltransferase
MTNKDYSHLLEIKLDVKDINHILNSIKFLRDKDIPEEDRLIYKEKFIGWLSQFKLSLDDLAIEDLI